ncbi:ABC transporter ATP-binding protein [Pinisolibacter sp.]|uniref:ABC transporter ATP-binding protein n=1 Tax=Pinisolibacter sp. TaxID=2172024 RepID=UPI002FDD8C9F
MASASPLIRLEGLSVSFDGVRVLHGVDLDIGRGGTLGLVGESGSGKSVTWLAALGLLPGKARIEGRALLDGEDLIAASDRRLDAVRGGRIAMIFQDPASALNPVLTIRRQIGEALALHRGLSGRAVGAEAKRLLDLVGIPDAERRLSAYPHEFSGGQNQRVMIAMALAGQPDLLVADEPTTALDVTIQAQILDLLDSVRRETGMALVLISHDLGVVSQTCDRVAVMYAGRIVEEGPSSRLFADPAHPYTRGLIGALPPLDGSRRRLVSIAGTVPDPRDPPPGCAFAPRCLHSDRRCTGDVPQIEPIEADRRMACVLAVHRRSEIAARAGREHTTAETVAP